MRKTPILLALLAVVALALAPALVLSQGSAVDRATLLIRNGNFDEAIS